MRSKVRLRQIRISRFVIAGLLFACSASASAQTVAATVPVGASPGAIAVNSSTNKIYVANCGSNTITVIDGGTNATTTIAVSTQSECPHALAVNPATNQLYVADNGDITVIDGATNDIVVVLRDDNGPNELAVNAATNKIYVADYNSAGAVRVIDGATNSVTYAIPVGLIWPYNLAVNTATDELYVTSWTDYGPTYNVTVLDAASGNVTTVTDPSGVNPFAVAINAVTNKIYVANVDDCGNGPCDNFGSIAVIDGATNSTANVYDPVVFGPHGVAVNSATNKIYVSNFSTVTSSHDGGVTVLDGATNSFTHVTDPNAQTGGCSGPVVDNMAVDPVTGNVYVANFCSSNITVVNGQTNSPTTLTDPNASGLVAVAVNPTTDKIYVVNGSSNNVTVIDGGAGAANVTLSMSLAGAGSSGGTVASVPPGISCPGTCSATFSGGTSVSLTASFASPSTFAGWSGACAGTAACNVTMSANENVTATFGSSAISVSLSPFVASIPENTVQLFTANVAGDSKSLGVTWSISTTCNPGPVQPACDGALSPASPTTANYISPNGSVGVSVAVTATSVADITKSASATFTIAPGPPPEFILTAQSPTMTAQPGQDAVDELTIGSGPNFVGTVQLSCVVTGPSPVPPCTLNGYSANTSCDLTGNGTCTPLLEVDLPASAPTSDIYTATVTGTSGADQHVVQVTVTVAPDFTLTPASTLLTMQPGEQGTDVITLAGVNGPFGSAIQLTCVVSGPSPAPTCAFSPTSVTPGSGSVTSTLTITAPAAGAQSRLAHARFGKFVYAMWLPLIFGITVAARSKKPSLGRLIFCCALLLLLMLQIACGGSGGGSGNHAPTNYTVTVTGTSGTLQHTAQIMVTVQ